MDFPLLNFTYWIRIRPDMDPQPCFFCDVVVSSLTMYIKGTVA